MMLVPDTGRYPTHGEPMHGAHQESKVVILNLFSKTKNCFRRPSRDSKNFPLTSLAPFLHVPLPSIRNELHHLANYDSSQYSSRLCHPRVLQHP